MGMWRRMLVCAALAGLCVALSSFVGRAEDVVPPGESSIEVVFVLDTTGSMSGLIQGAKEKIWSIANLMVTTRPKPKIKIGLVGYRDRGDAYVTKLTPLSDDLDAVYADLMQFQAGGGGDGPESVNQALHEAVTKMAWSKESGIYRVVFLVGDWPPHMDYQDDVKYPESCKLAAEKHILINTIQCGGEGSTVPVWQEIARLAEGKYFKVDQSGGAVVVATPFDGKLVELSKKLDETRLSYGSDAGKALGAEQAAKAKEIGDKASVTAQAERVTYTYNTTIAGVTGVAGAAGPPGPISAVDTFARAGNRDLLNDIVNNVVALDKVEEKQLPDNMQKMTPEERAAYIKTLQDQRAQLMKDIAALATQRAQFQADEMKKLGDKGKGSFDAAVSDSITEQRTKVEAAK